MSITGISTTGSSGSIGQTGSTSSSSTSFQSRMEEGKKLWDSLAQALESGDLASAKEAFQTLQENRPEPPPGGAKGPQGAGKGQGNGPEQDFQTLQEALESGDIEAAKSALETIQSHRPKERPPEGGLAFDPSFNNDTTGTVGTLLNLVA